MVLEDRSEQGFSGLQGSTDQLTAVLRRFHEGSGRSGITRGEESRRRSELTCAEISGKFPCVQASESWVEALGSFLVPRQSYGGVWPRWRCSGAAGP